MTLLGPDGRPMAATYKKADPPKIGPAFGAWSGRDQSLFTLPGGAALQFDLSRLTLDDFRAMRDHPQVNASLTVLTFMMHGLDWHIRCENKKIKSMIEENLRIVWTRLIRAVSQAYWAGYSPVAIEYENDIQNRQIVFNKFKDLIPEETRVHWKDVEGYAPPNRVKPKFKVFDGIEQVGSPGPIPVENSLWYPLLMENGDYYGKKLLRPAFTSWYFSILMHLFSNRYFERFGEPTPVGRAPFDEEVQVGSDGSKITGKQAMELILTNLRSRGVVVLPSDRDPVSKEYEYTIEHLESQMRGVDFERYLTRLDEEISLSIFTPVLLLRTADVGSYNLGVGHMQMYMWMLNALAGDLKEYIDNYVINRLKDFNFGPNAPRAYWEYRRMGKESVETVRAIVTALVTGNKASVNLEELSDLTGFTLKEVRQQLNDPNNPDDPDDEIDPNADPDKDNRQRIRDDKKSKGPKGVGQPRATTRQISSRVRTQVQKAWRDNSFGSSFEPDLGYRKRFEESLLSEGFNANESRQLTEKFYDTMANWSKDAIFLGKEEYAGPQDFLAMFDRLMDSELDQMQRGS